MCVMFGDDGLCAIQPFKPETCVAGPFTFDVKEGVIEIYLKKESICPLVAVLKQDRKAYDEQYKLAVDKIIRVVAFLPEEELMTVCRIEEPDTEKVEELIHRVIPMTIGTEHEYSINDRDFRPLPINDKIIEELNGEVVNEFQFGDVNLSKELQKNVIEIVPSVPGTSVQGLEGTLYGGLKRLYQATHDHTVSWGWACTPC